MKGKDILKIRKVLGWSQAKLGVEIGYKPKGARMRICELENERRPINDRIEKLINFVYFSNTFN
jgi:transcriptional regulator with XRE-family HTH domain